MRPQFEPRLVNDEFGDPGLFVDFRDEKRALLFDLGDVCALPPRKLLRISHIFVTHTHVDHFIGFDHWLRIVLGRKERITLYGGPDLIAQVGHKLAAYAWNVVQRYEIGLTLDVIEIDADGQARRAFFSSRDRFARVEGAPLAQRGDLLHAEEAFRVRARFLDHDIPCLAFALDETAHVNVWKNKLAEMGLTTGPWLRAVKRAVVTGAPDDTPIEVSVHGPPGARSTVWRLRDLRPALDVVPGQRIGYVTDVKFTPDNLRELEALLGGVDLLFIESVFLDAESAHAERKNHLTATQAGDIARRLGARAVVPFHFSPRYQGRAAEVLAEVRTAWMRSSEG